MRLVARAAHRPMRCAALPYIGQNHESGFVDTGSELIGGWDNHVYISVVAVKEMARLINWVPPGELRAVERDVEQLRAELQIAKAELEEAQRVIAAVDVIESEGFRARKKSGRPKVEA
jgi:hypothetical protein